MAGQAFVDDDERFPMPSLAELVELHERVVAARAAGAGWSRSRSTRATSTTDAARAAIAAAEAETGLPADDPVRFGADAARRRRA